MLVTPLEYFKIISLFIIKSIIKSSYQLYFLFAYTLFLLILFNNSIGLIPCKFIITSYVIINFLFCFSVFMCITLIFIWKSENDRSFVWIFAFVWVFCSTFFCLYHNSVYLFNYNLSEFVNLPISEIGINYDSLSSRIWSYLIDNFDDFLELWEADKIELKNNLSNIDRSASVAASVQGDPKSLESNLVSNTETLVNKKTSSSSSDILATASNPRPHKPLFNTQNRDWCTYEEIVYPVAYSIQDASTLRMYYQIIESFNNLCHYLDSFNLDALREYHGVIEEDPVAAQQAVDAVLEYARRLQQNRRMLETHFMEFSISREDIENYHMSVKKDIEFFTQHSAKLPYYVCEKKYLSRAFNGMLC